MYCAGLLVAVTLVLVSCSALLLSGQCYLYQTGDLEHAGTRHPHQLILLSKPSNMDIVPRTNQNTFIDQDNRM